MINRKTLFLLILLFTLVLGIRLFHFSFFEMKDDQIISMWQEGGRARAAHFLISHGGVSGIGINTPPYFADLMGVLTFFSGNPFWVTFFFFLLNLAAFILAVFYFYTRLPTVYAVISSLVLAFSPAFTIYSDIIWLQSLLPVFVIILFIQMDNFIKRPRGMTFIFLCVISAIAAGLHMSGFFLFPGLLLIAILHRKEIGLKSFIAACTFVFTFFLPYFYYLIFENGIGKVVSYGPFGSKPVYWEIFRQHIRLASVDFFRYYFKRDFFPVLDKAAGSFKTILYPLSWGLIVFFIIGIAYYLFWVIKNRRLFDVSLKAQAAYPVPFQVAGFVFFTVSLTYLFLRVQTPPHYLIVLFPAYSLLTGFGAYKLWNFKITRYVFFGSVSATLVLLVAVLFFLKQAGGHPQEYGLSYDRLIRIENEIRRIVPEKTRVGISVSFTGKGKTDTLPFDYIQSDLNKHALPGGMAVPVDIVITWNKELMRYEHSVTLRKNSR